MGYTIREAYLDHCQVLLNLCSAFHMDVLVDLAAAAAA